MSDNGREQIPGVDLGWANEFGGEPMDWLAWFGVGAIAVGIGIALICDLFIRLLAPKSMYVSDVIRELSRDYPVIIFTAGAVCYHLFLTVVTRKG